MLISDVCRRTGLTRKAIRYYIEQSLVAPSALPNGYLEFTDADVERLARIGVLRQLGLSVADTRRSLDDGAPALRDICARRQLDAQTRAQRDAILACLAQNMDYAAATRALAQLERRATLAEKLLDAFPGYFGRFLCAHFGALLGDELATDDQRAAYAEVIAFLDGLPDLPREVQDYFDALDELPLDEVDCARQSATDALRAVAAEPVRYLDTNADAISQYLEYIRSPEYLRSPMYRVKRALSDFCRASGYNDVFIPALMRLSPSYAQYKRDLERADAALRERFGPEQLGALRIVPDDD